MMNQKGVIALAGWVVYLLVGIASVAVMALTPLGDSVGIHYGNAGQKTTQKATVTITPAKGPDGKAVYVKDAAGNVAPLMQTTTTTSDEVTTPAVPWWKKLLAMGWIYLALCIAGLFFAPLGIIMGAINHKIGTEAQAFISHAKTIVASVDSGWDEFDKVIAGAKTAIQTAQASAAASTDPAVIAANQGIINTQTAIINVVTNLEKDVKDAMTMVQGKGSAVESVVTSLQAK